MKLALACKRIQPRAIVANGSSQSTMLNFKKLMSILNKQAEEEGKKKSKLVAAYKLGKAAKKIRRRFHGCAVSVGMRAFSLMS